MANVSLYTGVATQGTGVSLPQWLLDVYSTELERVALPIMRFEEFAVKKTDLQAQPGQNIVFTRMGDIPGGGALREGVPIVTQALNAAQYSITVTEYGNAVQVSEKFLQMATKDALAEAAIQLGRNYAKIKDKMLRDTVLSSSNVIFANNRASRAALDPDSDEFNVECIRSAVEWLATKNAPKFYLPGESPAYICFIHPHQAMSITRDPEWKATQDYNNTRALFTDELGRWMDVVFIATTVMPNGAAATTDVAYDASLVDAGTAGGTKAGHDVYKAAIFGDNAFGLATALPVEMRDDGLHDFGRQHSLGWYSIEGTGLLNEDYVTIIETV